MLTNSKNSMGGEHAVGVRAVADGDLPRRRNPIFWLVICGVLLIAAIAAGTAMMVHNFRDRAIESSKRELENTVVLLARHFDQQLADAEIPLDELIEQIGQEGIATPDGFKSRLATSEIQRELADKVTRAFKVAGINIYDADGVLINSSETAAVPHVTISDRAYFKALRSSQNPTEPQIELVLSRFTGVWKTLITRKVAGKNGVFLGVVSRAIAPAKFEEFFSAVVLGKDASIAMHHHDGKLLARYPHVEEIMGKDFKANSTPEAAAILDQVHGTAQLMSSVDGSERLVAIQKSRSLPNLDRGDRDGRVGPRRMACPDQISGYRGVPFGRHRRRHHFADRAAAEVAIPIVAVADKTGKATPRYCRREHDLRSYSIRSAQAARRLQQALYRNVRVIPRRGETGLLSSRLDRPSKRSRSDPGRDRPILRPDCRSRRARRDRHSEDRRRTNHPDHAPFAAGRGVGRDARRHY